MLLEHGSQGLCNEIDQGLSGTSVFEVVHLIFLFMLQAIVYFVYCFLHFFIHLRVVLQSHGMCTYIYVFLILLPLPVRLYLPITHLRVLARIPCRIRCVGRPGLRRHALAEPFLATDRLLLSRPGSSSHHYINSEIT